MEKPMKPSMAILSCINMLKDEGSTQSSHKWQAIDSPDQLFEVTDLFFKVNMPESIEEMADETLADLPWSENHFQERVSGIPANPGYQYLHWPYYRPTKHNDVFRAEGSGLFSHTYMERFWPDTTIMGTGAMKYPYGDFGDLINRLEKDPGTRQAFFAIWHPSDQSNNGVRLPCTIGYHFTLRDGKINITYLIRSCDAFRHFKNDVYMTMRLAKYVAEQLLARTGIEYKMGTLSMWIGSFHCFNQEIPLIQVFASKYIKKV